MSCSEGLSYKTITVSLKRYHGEALRLLLMRHQSACNRKIELISLFICTIIK